MSSNQKLLCISIPKSGTYLLNKLIKKLGFQEVQQEVLNSWVGEQMETRNPEEIFDESGNLMTEQGKAYILDNWISKSSYDYFDENLHRIASQIEEGFFMSGHIQYSTQAAEIFKSHGIKIMLIFRDPRLVALSHYHWIMKNEKHPCYPLFSELPLADCIRYLFKGHPPQGTEQVYGCLPLKWKYKTYIEWITKYDAGFVFFENLAGSQAGGSNLVRNREVLTIYKTLGFTEPDVGSLEPLLEDLYGNTATFRSGKIDLPEQQKELFQTPDLKQEVDLINRMLAKIKMDYSKEVGSIN